jgi:hypothetical protein
MNVFRNMGAEPHAQRSPGAGDETTAFGLSAAKP